MKNAFYLKSSLHSKGVVKETSGIKWVNRKQQSFILNPCQFKMANIISVFVLKCWEDSCKYFLEYLPLQKEYKYHLQKNQWYHRMKKCMGENAKVCDCNGLKPTTN